MLFSTRPIRLNLKHPFRIARETSEYKDNVLVSISDDKFTGIGEAAPSVYYGENADSVMQVLEEASTFVGDDPFALEATMIRLTSRFPGDSSALSLIHI